MCTPGNVVEDIVEGASSVKVASQEQVAEAAVVVERDVAACSHKLNLHESGVLPLPRVVVQQHAQQELSHSTADNGIRMFRYGTGQPPC